MPVVRRRRLGPALAGPVTPPPRGPLDDALTAVVIALVALVVVVAVVVGVLWLLGAGALVR